MINPAVETDLVGDVVEVYTKHWGDGAWPDRRVSGRGRVRAVTSATEGYIRVWLEVLDEECRRAHGHIHVEVGDIIVHTLYESETQMRLVRGE